MNKKIAIGIVLVAIVAIGAFLVLSHKSTNPGGIQSTTDISTSAFTTISVQNGESNGGLYTTAARTVMTQGTTTVCAVQSPNATSTLTEASTLFTVSSTTASIVTIAKAATAFATTTLLGQAYTIAANAQATIAASSTTANATAQDYVFAPSQWVVVGMAGGTGTFSPVGVCTAEFQVLQ